MATELACSIASCERLVGRRGARGLCPRHYQRLNRHGRTSLLERPVAVCSVSGCEDTARKRGWCSAHYSQWRRLGEVKPFRFHRQSHPFCRHCRRVMPPGNRRMYCSSRCQRIVSAHDGARALGTACRQCGAVIDFRSLTESGQFKRVDALLCGQCRGRRAAGRGATSAELALRDGTSCGICQEPVDMTLTFPHLRSPTVDHVKPWANGGSHDARNLQLAHLHCNSAKHNVEAPPVGA